MAAYSFQDVNAAIVGVGGSFNLASGAGSADEGIVIAAVSDKNTMTIGADGTPMHSLNASTASTVTVNLLKTSPVKALLMSMYNAQSASSANWGDNVITVSILQTGEIINLTQCAFKKTPNLEYALAAKSISWTFDCGRTSPTLGAY
jgi:hypothetical protein